MLIYRWQDEKNAFLALILIIWYIVYCSFWGPFLKMIKSRFLLIQIIVSLILNNPLFQNNLERKEFDTRSSFTKQVDTLQREVKALRRQQETETLKLKTAAATAEVRFPWLVGSDNTSLIEENSFIFRRSCHLKLKFEVEICYSIRNVNA